MELVELRGKKKGTAEPVTNGDTLATQAQKKGKRRARRNGDEGEEEGDEEEAAVAGSKKKTKCTCSSEQVRAFS